MAKDKNTNLNRVCEFITQTTGEAAKTIAVPIELIHFVGKPQKAVFLAQLIYWSDKSVRPDKFIYKTRKDWKKETGLSGAQIGKFTKEFKCAGFLDTKVKKADKNPTVHYKLDIDKLLISLSEFLTKRNGKNCSNEIEESDESLTESTTENTTKEREEYSHSDLYSNQPREQVGREWEETTNVSGSAIVDSDVILGIVVPEDEEVLLTTDFVITEEMRTWAQENVKSDVDVDFATQKFIIFYDGQKQTDWIKAWKLWMLREQVPQVIPPRKLSAGEERLAELRRKQSIDMFADIT